MPWVRHRQLFPDSGPWSNLDRVRAFRPAVLEEPDGTLRMWYSGHDGEVGRILEAVHEPGQAWRRLGLSIDAGCTGTTDAHGVEAPSVVRTPTGFLMAYAGSDGTDTRLHMATSDDGHLWEAQGPFVVRGEADEAGELDVTHPCLVVTGDSWRLFYSVHDRASDGKRAEIMTAVSSDGVSWDRAGTVLAPSDDETALSEPSVLVRQRYFTMIFVCDDGSRTTLDLATSRDGVSWDRRGSTLRVERHHRKASRVRSPLALNLGNGGIRLWYALRTATDEPGRYRLWSTDFVKKPTP